MNRKIFLKVYRDLENLVSSNVKELKSLQTNLKDIKVDTDEDVVYHTTTTYIEKLIASARSQVRKKQLEDILDYAVTEGSKKEARSNRRSEQLFNGKKEVDDKPKEKKKRSETVNFEEKVLPKSKKPVTKEVKKEVKKETKTISKNKMVKKEIERIAEKINVTKNDNLISFEGWYINEREINKLKSSLSRSKLTKIELAKIAKENKINFNIELDKTLTINDYLNKINLEEIIINEFELKKSKLINYTISSGQFVILQDYISSKNFLTNDKILAFKNVDAYNIKDNDLVLNKIKLYEFIKKQYGHYSINDLNTIAKENRNFNIYLPLIIIPMISIINFSYNNIMDKNLFKIEKDSCDKSNQLKELTNISTKRNTKKEDDSKKSDDDIDIAFVSIFQDTKSIILSIGENNYNIDYLNPKFPEVKELVTKYNNTNITRDKKRIIKKLILFIDFKKNMEQTLSNVLLKDVKIIDGTLLINNVIFKGSQINDLVRFIDNNDIENGLRILKFLERLSLNPLDHARNELYDFALHNNLKITSAGTLLVYRSMNDNYVDGHTRSMFNYSGFITCLPLDSCDQNSRNSCSRGLHLCTPSYGKYSSKLLIAEVDPKDIVSIPKEYKSNKMRCRAFKGIVEISDYERTLGFKDFINQLEYVSHYPTILQWELQKVFPGVENNYKISKVSKSFRELNFNYHSSDVYNNPLITSTSATATIKHSKILITQKSIKNKDFEKLVNSINKKQLHKNYLKISDVEKILKNNDDQLYTLLQYFKNEHLKESAKLDQYLLLSQFQDCVTSYNSISEEIFDNTLNGAVRNNFNALVVN